MGPNGWGISGETLTTAIKPARRALADFLKPFGQLRDGVEPPGGTRHSHKRRRLATACLGALAYCH